MIKVEKYNERYIGKFTTLFNQWDVPREFSKEELSKGIDESINLGNNSMIMALDENDEMVGYALYGKCYFVGFEPFIEIHQIIVDNKKRSNGIGAKLVEFIEQEAKKENIYRVKLSSQSHRERAHKFYTKMGYSVFKQSHFFEKKIEK